MFTGEEDPDELKDGRLPDDTWLESKRLEVGEGSALWTSKVLGQFPEDAADGIVPTSWLAKCRIAREWAPEKLDPKWSELGIDVGASDNGDKTVVWHRLGPKLMQRWEFQMRDHYKLAAVLVKIIRLTKAKKVKIDCTGVGHGLANLLTAYGAKGKHAAAGAR